MHLTTRTLDRRTFLRGTGVALALPWLDAMTPARASGPGPDQAPRRLVAINTNLGLLADHFFPEQSGRDYQLSPYLETIAPWRDQFTVISGSSHPDVTGGHSAEVSYLTAAPHPGSASFRNTISLDQFAAERIGNHTRVPSLPLSVARSGNQSLSFTNSGVMLPAENSPAALFQALFVGGDPAETERQLHQLRLGRSIMDTVAERAKALQREVGAADRERLDQYFTSVREVEQRLLTAEEWEHQPRPKVDEPAPTDGEYLLEKLSSMYDLVRLALATDSTRLITLMIRLDGFSEHIPGVSTESHNLSHHVGRQDKLQELKNLELAQFRELARFLQGLTDAGEGGTTLLDHTAVLHGSNLGNGNSHDTRNLPMLLAGGGFRHGQHLAFDRDRNYPLPKLFVSLLQRLGIDTDRFAGQTGTMSGLEMT